MLRFLLPPEAREQSDAFRTGVCSPEGLTIASLLAVTVPITVALSFEYAPVILPTTALVAYAFWRLGRRVTQPRGMVLYCFVVGALAGVLNSWLTLLFWALWFKSWMLRYVDADVFGRITAIGAGIGIAYGTAYLLPMLIQLSARSLRRTEAVDRCLISYGTWGVLVLFLALYCFFAYVDTYSSQVDLVLVLGLGSTGVHTLMLSIGLIRWARRRSWLDRVVSGQVPGWLVCEQQRFQRSELEGLEVFCKPLRDRTPPDGFRVLARGSAAVTATGETYRSAPIAPKFLIVERRPVAGLRLS